MHDDLQINNAVSALKSGGIIAYPTEAVFGLGCDPRNDIALQKLINLKKRDPSKGLILIAGDIEQLQPFIEEDSFDLQPEIKKQWPGPITWILPCKKNVSPLLSGNRNTLAVRVSAHPTVKKLCEAYAGAIVSTSANVSGEEPFLTSDDLSRFFANDISTIINAPLGGNADVSAIFDALTGEQLR